MHRCVEAVKESRYLLNSSSGLRPRQAVVSMVLRAGQSPLHGTVCGCVVPVGGLRLPRGYGYSTGFSSGVRLWGLRADLSALCLRLLSNQDVSIYLFSLLVTIEVLVDAYQLR